MSRRKPIAARWHTAGHIVTLGGADASPETVPCSVLVVFASPEELRAAMCGQPVVIEDFYRRADPTP